MNCSGRVAAFIEDLTQSSGSFAARPFVLRSWQREIIERIYDPIHVDGKRVVRTAFITMPRKNGKSELAAALALYHLLGDSERGGQVYSAAADRHQASLVFNATAQMVGNDIELPDLVNIIETVKRMVHYGSGSFYQAMHSDNQDERTCCLIQECSRVGGPLPHQNAPFAILNQFSRSGEIGSCKSLFSRSRDRLLRR